MSDCQLKKLIYKQMYTNFSSYTFLIDQSGSIPTQVGFNHSSASHNLISKKLMKDIRRRIDVSQQSNTDIEYLNYW